MSEKARQQKYRTSVKGILAVLYAGAVQKSKRRNHVPPEYSLEEFRAKYETDTAFLALYNTWVKSNYATMLKPSIDRLDNTKPYSFDNIQMVDWQTNLFNANKITTPLAKHKPVFQQDKDTGEVLAEYSSALEASIQTGINKSHISAVCNQSKTRYTAGGYKWTFKNA